jgi:hypothetical protein
MESATKELISSGALGAVLALVLLMLFWVVKVLVTNSTEQGKAMVKGVEDLAKATAHGMEELVTQSRVIRDNCLVCRQDSVAAVRDAQGAIEKKIENSVASGHDKTFAETERLVCEATKQIKESLTGVANSIRLTNEETLREMENERLREQLDESRAHNITPSPSGVVQR